MNTFIYQTQRVLIVVAMSAMMGYGEEPKSAGGSPAPKIEKTLVAHPGETLQVNSRYASQTIDSQAGNQVSVVVTRRVLEQYEHDADRILREHEVEISRHDHGITIYTDVDDAVSERWQADYKTVPPLRVHVKVLVPKQGYDVVARTTFGSQDIQNINGSVHADARQDAIIINVLGDIEVNSIFGGLTIRDVGGSVLRAKAREKVDIKTVQRDILDASSSFGSLVLDDVTGVAYAHARKAITASNVGGDLSASSSFGSVTIHHVGGSVRAKARGDIELKNVAKEASINSSFGKVRRVQ